MIGVIAQTTKHYEFFLRGGMKDPKEYPHIYSEKVFMIKQLNSEYAIKKIIVLDGAIETQRELLETLGEHYPELTFYSENHKDIKTVLDKVDNTLKRDIEYKEDE